MEDDQKKDVATGTERIAEEEQREKTETKPEKKYSDEDLDEILNAKFARWQKKQQKAIDEATKLAKMDEQQKAEYERDKLQKELEELRNANTRNEMGKTARKMLSEKGIRLPDDLLGVLLTTEAESTKANVDSFARLFQESVDAAVTEKLKSKTPERMSGRTAITRSEILAVSDPDERRKLIEENLELFNQ